MSDSDPVRTLARELILAAGMISLLVLKGMSTPDAIAATVFIRLATLWFAVLIGLVALIKSRHDESSGTKAI